MEWIKTSTSKTKMHNDFMYIVRKGLYKNHGLFIYKNGELVEYYEYKTITSINSKVRKHIAGKVNSYLNLLYQKGYETILNN